tara:strand:- start:35 stop:688 length:654 start_codon:yes stop_codon:yes gene_type:complete
MFDFSKINNFDKHINMSIPHYDTLIKNFCNLINYYSQYDSIVLDLGCSTGHLLSSLQKKSTCKYIGVDTINFKENSSNKNNWSFVKQDIETYLSNSLENKYSIIASVFTLQFLCHAKRKNVLQYIKNHIDNNTTFLIAEKVYLDDTILQTLIHKLHLEEKRKNFKDKEILDKELQLLNSMFCLSEKELYQELKNLGKVTKIWQSYNFMAFVVTKETT